MIGALIIIGLCYLGLLACGIVLFVDDIRAKKFAKKNSKILGKLSQNPLTISRYCGIIIA